MRDVVALFVEASVAKGEWRAALSALQLSATTEGVLAAPPFFQLSGALAAQGAWAAALSVLRSAPAPAAGASSDRGRYSSAYLQGRVQAYQQVLTAYHTVAPPRLGDDRLSRKSDAREVADRTWALAKEALAVSGSPAPLPEAPAVSNSPRSVATEACEGSVNDFLLWCRTALLPQQQQQQQQSPSGSSVDADPSLYTAAATEKTAAAMRELTVLSAAALRGVSEDIESVAPPAASDAPAASSVSRIKSELRSLLYSNASRARGAWATALGLVRELPSAQMSPRLFTALLRHLAHHRRRDDVIALTCECLQLTLHTSTASSGVTGSFTTPSETFLFSAPLPPEVVASLRSDSVVLKTVAEACHRLRCVELATQLLDPALSRGLTPSAAVPLVMTLHNAGDDAAVVEWWDGMKNARGPQRYPLRKHAKLCSYVAACVLRSATRPSVVCSSSPGQRPAAAPMTSDSVALAARGQADWARVMTVFSEAEAPASDPALVLLFQLRLLRQMRQWEAAVQLLHTFRAAHPNGEDTERTKPPPRRHRPSSTASPRRCRLADQHGRPTAMEGVQAVLTEERAEQWIPADALAELCQQFSRPMK